MNVMIKTVVLEDGTTEQSVIDDLTQAHTFRIANAAEAGFRGALEILGWLPPEKVAETVRQAGEVMRERAAQEGWMATDGECEDRVRRAILSLKDITPGDLTEKTPRGLRYSTAPLKAALAEYDRTKPDRDALFEQIDSNEDVEAWEAEELAALRKVQEAFYEVTKDRNSREDCERISVEYARCLVEAHP